MLKTKDYDRQYAQLYFYRLLQMRKFAEAAAQRAWPGIPGRGGWDGCGGGRSVVWRRTQLPAVGSSRPPQKSRDTHLLLCAAVHSTD